MRVEKILYALINPLIRGLLRSPFHRLGSRNLAILSFTGRKSGKSYDTPLSYVRDDQTVLFLSSRQTKWWRNFTAEPAPVEVELENKRYSGHARLFTDGTPDSSKESETSSRNFLVMPWSTASNSMVNESPRKRA